MKHAGSPILKVEWIGDDRRAVVVEAVGDIDLHRSAEFQEELLALPEQRPEQIIVDLSGVTYMDSSGVASLVKLLARVRRTNMALKLVGLTPRVRSVFEITRLETVFEIYPSREEALRS
jgi:anti-sigma B factor antagonist